MKQPALTGKHIEVFAQQLTESWFQFVADVVEDPLASPREKRLAELLADSGIVINALIHGLHNGKVLENDSTFDLYDAPPNSDN